MANKPKRPFRTGQLIRRSEHYQGLGAPIVRLILRIRDVKIIYSGTVNHYRKYTFLNPNGTTGWEKWDVWTEQLYEVVQE